MQLIFWLVVDTRGKQTGSGFYNFTEDTGGYLTLMNLHREELLRVEQIIAFFAEMCKIAP